MSGTPDQRAAEAVAQLRAAYDAARAAITSTGDLHARFDIASAVTAACQAMTEDAAELRAATTTRIYDANPLSLAGLAKMIGVSKARADQLVRSGRQAQEKEMPCAGT